MKKILIGVGIGICIPLLVGYLFVICGGMPVATKGPPLPMEKFLTKKALHAVMDKEAGKQSPLPADEPNLLAGARVYQVQCGVCHGRLGQHESAISRGMFPHPPQLLPPRPGVTDDPVGETYWKVRNGIRLTGMPGFSETLSDSAIWQVSLLLLHADTMPPSAQLVLQSRPDAGEKR